MSSSINSYCVDMDVDAPPVNGSSTSSNNSTLKRCSSAPMINETNSSVMTTASPSSSSSRDPQSQFNLFGSLATTQTRTRRFSASFSPVPGSPVSGLRLTPRISQLRQEEHADVSNLRELAHEREIHHAMQISQSWEDLNLMTDSSSSQGATTDIKSGKMGPLHVTLPPYSGLNCSSPSPTRLSSPGFQSPTRGGSRTFIRRSASPVLRPSPLGVKRKLDDDKLDCHHRMSPRAKRFHSSYTAIDRGGLLTTTSSSLPGSLSSVGTPESLSSADSPNFNFRSLDPSSSPSLGSGGSNSGGGGAGRAMVPEPMIVSKNEHDMNENSG